MSPLRMSVGQVLFHRSIPLRPNPTPNSPPISKKPNSMGFEEGIRLLQELGARPDALYWEGFPHEENVLATLKLVHEVGAGGRRGEMEIDRWVMDDVCVGVKGRVSCLLTRSYRPFVHINTPPGLPQRGRRRGRVQQRGGAEGGGHGGGGGLQVRCVLYRWVVRWGMCIRHRPSTEQPVQQQQHPTHHTGARPTWRWASAGRLRASTTRRSRPSARCTRRRRTRPCGCVGVCVCA